MVHNHKMSMPCTPDCFVDPTQVDMTVDPTSLRMRGFTAHGNMRFDVPYMTQVAENLWQGGCMNGLILPDFITHLVSLYPWEHYTVEHEVQTSLQVMMYDALNEDASKVIGVANWVNACRKTGPVLVHCQAGLNRSSITVGAALVLNGEMTGAEAVNYIREQRSPACLCNPAFEEWLRNFSIVDKEKHPEWDACKKT